MKWKVTSATSGELHPSGTQLNDHVVRLELDFDGAELSRLRPDAAPLPMGRLYLELELGGLTPLFRQALGNKSGLTQTLWGSLVVRTAGARRRR